MKEAWTPEVILTINLKFDQVMFNKNFEVTFGIFLVLASQINVVERYLDIFVF